MSNETYTLSDLAGTKRTQFVEDARNGRARIRDKDGQNLVMLREQQLEVLEQFAVWSQAQQRLQAISRSAAMPGVSELGDLAWVRVFDLPDVEELADELLGALISALADEDVSLITEVVTAWKTTARQLDDPLRRSILLTDLEVAAFDEVEAPNGE